MNAGSGRTWGLESQASFCPSENWLIGGQVSWVKGKVDSPSVLGGSTETQNFSKLPPLQGRLFTQWTSDNDRFWAMAEMEVAAEADDLSLGERTGNDSQRIPTNGTPGYTLLHLRGGAALTDSLNLTLGIENMGNRDYRVHGSGVNGGGTNGILTLEYSW